MIKSTGEKKLSIILSVYNAEKYLKKCLQSIVLQTYFNIELIIIDDGSTDNSATIINNYKNQYPFIKVFTQKNKGLAYARNKGISKISGDLVTFVDADDLLDIHMCDWLIYIMEKEKADIIYTDFQHNMSLQKNKLNISYKICNSLEAVSYYFKSKLGNVCGGIFKAELFQNLYFPNGLIYEDNPVKLELLLNSNKTIFCHAGLYYYRRNPKSITNSRLSIRNFDILKIGYLQKNILLNKEKTIYQQVKYSYLDLIADMFFENIQKALLAKDFQIKEILKLVPISYLLQVIIYGLYRNPIERFWSLLSILISYRNPKNHNSINGRKKL